MTPAQEAVTALADWIKASSAPRKTPLGGDTLVGPFAVLVPLALNQAPAPAFDPGALPLWIPDTQAPADLPAIDTSAPASQDHKAQRMGHIVWMVQEGRFPGVQLIDLTDPGETLQTALDREAPGLDLDQTAAVFLPRW
jgi:hypothetical protein